MWTATYLMQKASYNNHYYLLILLCLLMLALPAHTYFSADAKKHPIIKSMSMPQWCKWVIVLQLFIMYSYAAIAKLYPDWLNLTAVKLLMQGKANYPIIGALLQKEWMHYFVAYGGILFDGLVIPALLWKPTRKWAFIASLFFHLFNSIVFQVGIFPYLALAFTLFFFHPETIRNIFLKKKTLYIKNEVIIPNYKKTLWVVGSIFFLIQLILPVRHWFIKDDVLWTEEGHRMSWRMMLRTKSGYIKYKVVDKKTKTITVIDPKKDLTQKQLGIVFE